MGKASEASGCPFLQENGIFSLGDPIDDIARGAALQLCREVFIGTMDVHDLVSEAALRRVLLESAEQKGVDMPVASTGLPAGTAKIVRYAQQALLTDTVSCGVGMFTGSGA